MTKKIILSLLLVSGGMYGKTIGIENHNGGNIRVHSIKGWSGAVGLNEWKHIIFATDLDGIRAIRRVLRGYDRKHRLDKLGPICWRWVGPAKTYEQLLQKKGYLRSICQKMNMTETSFVDLRDRHVMMRLAKAIVYSENGSQPYPDSLYREAFNIGCKKCQQ